MSNQNDEEIVSDELEIVNGPLWTLVSSRYLELRQLGVLGSEVQISLHLNSCTVHVSPAEA